MGFPANKVNKKAILKAEQRAPGASSQGQATEVKADPAAMVLPSQARRRLIRSWLSKLSLGWHPMRSHFYRGLLAGAGYPPDLYEAQAGLEKLEFQDPQGMDLGWLKSKRLKELSITGPARGRPPALNRLGKLELDIGAGYLEWLKALQGNSRLRAIEVRLPPSSSGSDGRLDPMLSGLRALSSLSVHAPSLPHDLLVACAAHPHLKQVDCHLAAVDGACSDFLDPIAKGLAEKGFRLSIGDLSTNALHDGTVLPGLSKVANLDLRLNHTGGTGPIDLSPLAILAGLSRLYLDFSFSSISAIHGWDAVAGSTSLTHLTLDLRFSGAHGLDGIAAGRGIDHLYLIVTRSQLAEGGIGLSPSQELNLHFAHLERLAHLQALSRLGGIRELTLDLRFCLDENLSAIRSLGTIPSLEGVRLDLRSVSRESLQEGLEVLHNVQELKRLRLDLSYAKVKHLHGIQQLGKLTDLELHAEQTAIRSLKELNSLGHLQHLALATSDTSLLRDLRLPRLRQLDLALWNLELDDLAFLDHLAPSARTTITFVDSRVDRVHPLPARAKSLSFIRSN